MDYIVRIVRDCSGRWPQVAGSYFAEFFPEVTTEKGQGRLFAVRAREEAKRFASQSDVLMLWEQYPQLQELSMTILPAVQLAGEKAIEAVLGELEEALAQNPL